MRQKHLCLAFVSDNSAALVDIMSKKSHLSDDHNAAKVAGDTVTAGQCSQSAGKHLSGSARKSPIVARSSTSDYFSDIGSRKTASPTDYIGDSVDFCDQEGGSPLLDFGRKERDYISKVIQITCQRTSLLRKNKFSLGQASTSPATATTLPGQGQSLSYRFKPFLYDLVVYSSVLGVNFRTV
jgi:hypothetical protein